MRRLIEKLINGKMEYKKMLKHYIFAVIAILIISFVFGAVPDDDKDGVPNGIDLCFNTSTNIVDTYGCSCKQKTPFEECSANNNLSAAMVCCSNNCSEDKFKAVCSQMISCYDSDGGVYLYINGTVSYNGTTWSDYCINNSALLEYSCLYGGAGMSNRVYYCYNGCSNGACLLNASRCNDYTLFNHCSNNKPYYCKGGILVDNCTLCGCPASGSCQPDGKCKASQGIDCFADASPGSGSSAYLYSLDDAVVYQTAIQALQEYANAKGVNVNSIDTSDEYIESVAWYVDRHMKWMQDGDGDGAQTAKETINSGGRGCGKDYCGDCEDHSILRAALLRALRVSWRCVFSVDAHN